MEKDSDTLQMKNKSGRHQMENNSGGLQENNSGKLQVDSRVVSSIGKTTVRGFRRRTTVLGFR